MVCSVSLWSISSSLKLPDPERPEAEGDPGRSEVGDSLSMCESCSRMGRTIAELKHMVEEHSQELFSERGMQLPDTPDPREGMSDIHFGLLPGYQVLGKTSINLSELPWVYQCGIESAVRTGSKVTFWYRGFLQEMCTTTSPVANFCFDTMHLKRGRQRAIGGLRTVKIKRSLVRTQK
jgi:hypothetical protein